MQNQLKSSFIFINIWNRLWIMNSIIEENIELKFKIWIDDGTQNYYNNLFDAWNCRTMTRWTLCSCWTLWCYLISVHYQFIRAMTIQCFISMKLWNSSDKETWRKRKKMIHIILRLAVDTPPLFMKDYFITPTTLKYEAQLQQKGICKMYYLENISNLETLNMNMLSFQDFARLISRIPGS